MLRATTGAKVFVNPSRVSHALHQSSLGKYIIEGETRSLGNGSALIVAVWEHNIPQIPNLKKPTFTLGKWEITCRRADRDGEDYKYARVEPLDDTDIEEIRDGFKSFGTEEVVKITWIPPRCLPRSTTGKWIRLKIRGPIPTKVAINQIVYWARPFLLPMLRYPGCLKTGHSINTCRAPRRCSRCNGPHSFYLDENTCTWPMRPYHCFQCGGSHGPRSIHCPHNQDVQQLYNPQAHDGVTLHEINKQIRELQLPKIQAHRRPPPPPKPATSTSSPARIVQPQLLQKTDTTP